MWTKNPNREHFNGISAFPTIYSSFYNFDFPRILQALTIQTITILKPSRFINFTHILHLKKGD